jgi:hypothetical protein
MTDSIQKTNENVNEKLNHYFIVDDNHGNMYRVGAQGDPEVILGLLRKQSRNVRYAGCKPEDTKKRGKGREFMGIKLVSCRYQYQLGVKKAG